MKNSVIALAILSFLFVSCSDSASTDTTEKISLPLKVGNSWAYNFFRITTALNDTTKDEILISVVRDTTVNGVHWFELLSDSRVVNEIMGGFYSNQDDGIHFTFKPFNEPPNFNDSHLFLHNPDYEIPDRVVEHSYFIGSIKYDGETKDSELNVISQNYFRTFYQLTRYEITYPIDPYDYKYIVSSENGFTLFENGYVSRRQSTDQDPRLKLEILARFELIEFREG